METKGKLYLVPTPIGNMEDITLRALRILREADAILAEDTRTSGVLLKHYEIEKPLKSYHIHNEHKTVTDVVERLKRGETLALVSDAGTPAISDPGFLLVRECVAQGVDVECLPGATAFVPALVKSGLPCDKFVFEGFLPHKKGRQTRIKELAQETRTIVMYESPHRIVKALKQLAEFFGEDRQVSVSRELSKMFEETVNGTFAEVIANLEARDKVKGEIVVVIAGLETKKKSKERT
ncbi:ribosomal RNA small subunit methyltransferase I [Fulvitalea axinellae]|uniref:Ribosomal RNA small subunit methyltransferase I n=1 Tax=Fulvitalea axinellae TaxID=1182444 RepID=A0AAU9CZR0_9BACT|nr:ribosomal RNA small subunit methyltransferase I [Fulvitalea axinellae]